MNGYSIALFLHIVGAFGFVVALGLEWTGLRYLHRAAHPEQIRTWMMTLATATRAGFVSMLAMVITGLYMMVTAWGGVPWLTVTLGALVLVIALSLALTRPRMMAIGKAMAAGSASPLQTVQHLADNSLLWLSIQTRIAIALGIVLLKVVKPDWGGSLLIIAVAIVLGVASALPLPRRTLVHEPTVN